ncbi:hypothetical protein DPMN_040350 [Dreissena polymorpha]|uniref:Uncharacterized protein n=1 Tax=Dreissena polymorpha TaxID=45954 RepID=A0A9D4CXM3_DREPO|nr:hypothetical protein DPMN_040350 [Dreissena polymorpha]
MQANFIVIPIAFQLTYKCITFKQCKSKGSCGSGNNSIYPKGGRVNPFPDRCV